MENASKALIIAGAILIAILLISVAVLIINSTGGMQDRVKKSSDTMEIQSFNSQFTVYEGSNVNASQVKALISLIKSSNAANGYKGRMLTDAMEDDKYVFLDSSDSHICITSSAGLNNNTKYTVEITGYSEGGYVNVITIKKPEVFYEPV